MRLLRLIAYLRVSTNGQVEDGFGLPVQREQTRKWARSNGHRIAEFLTDEGVSGATELGDRDGLATALERICQGRADALIVAKLDRLARNLTVQEAALAHVWRCGGQVFSVDQGEVLKDDPDDPMRTAMRQMVGVFSELERRMIAKRLRDGRTFKKNQGRYAGGRPPFGYRAEGGELVPDEREQEVLAEIRRHADVGMSLRTIAEALNSTGRPPKRGDRWGPEQVRRALRAAS